MLEMDDLWRGFLSEDIALPLFSSLITGILIGFERELRAKPAGLRTHALVCFASTLLMLAAARQGEWTVAFIPGTNITTDPTRMAHGVLTGIGFLCAGVIFRDGFSIHGLTTAASLWVTSAIGVLYGVGTYWLAVTGAIMTIGVLVLLRLINHLLPDRIEVRLSVAAAAESAFDAPALRRILRDRGLSATPVALNFRPTEGEIELVTRTSYASEDMGDDLARVLRAAPGVLRFSIFPTDEETPFESR